MKTIVFEIENFLELSEKKSGEQESSNLCPSVLAAKENFLLQLNNKKERVRKVGHGYLKWKERGRKRGRERRRKENRGKNYPSSLIYFLTPSLVT